MSGTLRFEILGPQRAWYGDREIDTGPGKQRAVLAVLLLSAGRPVPTAQIVDAVWPEEPPANGPNVVQKHVAGLRRVLEPNRSPRTPGQVLTLTDAGYLLRVEAEAVDAVRFERGIRRAQRRRTEGRPDEAAAELKAALDLWHGEPLTGFGGPLFDAYRQRLVELRAVALESRAELELECGRHRELVGELVELVAEFPVRERLRCQLMLALYRSGRQAEALAAYREIGHLLREEYGIEPGDALQELHRRILRSDPALVLPPPAVHLPSAAHPPSPPASSSTAGPTVVTEPSTVPSPRAAQPPVNPPEGRPPAAPPAVAAPPTTVPAPSAGPMPPVARSAVLPVALPPPPAPARNPRRGDTPTWLSNLGTALGVTVVLLSVGLLAWLVMLFYAIRRRSRWLALATVAYLSAVIIFVVGMEVGDPDNPTGLDGLAIICLLAALVGGVGQVILLNRGVAAMLRGQPGRRAVRAAEELRMRREHARHLLYHYPTARDELRIGRPDLPRSYDDGGLVDVNAVPDQVIANLPGLTPEQSWQIAADRRLRGPFVSVEELAGRCLLPPTSTEALRDILVFLPAPPPPAATPGPH